jgi:hypothetical protein
MDKPQSGNGSADANQEQKQSAAPELTQQQWDKLAGLAWLEIRHAPGFGSLSVEQRKEAITKRAYEMSAHPHYQRIVGFSHPVAQQPAPQEPSAQGPTADQPMAHESRETSKRQKQEAKPQKQEEFDPKEWIGMSSTQIIERLVQTGLVEDATNPESGLQIVGTSQRRSLDRDGLSPTQPESIEDYLKRMKSKDVTSTGRTIGITGMKPREIARCAGHANMRAARKPKKAAKKPVAKRKPQAKKAKPFRALQGQVWLVGAIDARASDQEIVYSSSP